MGGGWEAVVGKCVGLSVSQVHSKHDVDSVSNRHLSAPDDFIRFIILEFISSRKYVTGSGKESFRDTGRAGTAKNSRSARKVEAMSCSVTHASPVKARTSTRQEKCGFNGGIQLKLRTTVTNQGP